MAKIAILVMHNVYLKNGGMTFASLKKASLITDLFDEVRILTFGFDPNFEKNVAHWKEILDNGKKIQFFNLQIGSSSGRNPFPVKMDNPFEDCWADSQVSRFAVAGHPNHFRVFIDGEYRRYEQVSNEGLYTQVDLFESPWTRIGKLVFDDSGRRMVTHIMNRSLNKIEISVYYNRDGNVLYTVQRDARTQAVKAVFDHVREEQFETIEEFLSGWVKSHCSTKDDVTLFIEKREFAKPLSSIKGVRKVFVLHSTHLPFASSKLDTYDPSMQGVVDSMADLDCIVTLTNEQLKDLKRQFGNSTKFFVVHNPLPSLPASLRPSFDKNSLKVVSLARLHPCKNLEDAIQIMARVFDDVPNATYEIWGEGDERRKLEKLIAELGVADRVFLRGFTRDTSEVYKTAALTLMTSHYEGQSLVLGESMLHGVPVVTYDTKYGPRSLIRDGIDGRIVEKYDKEAARAAIVSLLSDCELRRSLSEEAAKLGERFPVAYIRDQWKQVFDQIGS